MTKISYEKPSFKKYGTMKNLTLGTLGSGGDGMGADLKNLPPETDESIDFNNPAGSDQGSTNENDGVLDENFVADAD